MAVAEITTGFIKEAPAIGVNGFNVYHKNRLIRVCFSRIETLCTEGETSYHSFYQLCAGAPPPLREKLNLKSVHEYKYLQQSTCYSINGVNDAEQFRIVVPWMLFMLAKRIKKMLLQCLQQSCG
ncbi:hypothetical protein L1987_23656 [Smallanthus sonchifolius]|uniref:Uncharacterized protein n=1 Tax=Smallanthus sonchifolius TaxID=185202 RepID=A0ACB9IIV3_9ASTR|nr:hypothetical protein L1987_23656 [Smallanthus sonchifolius]